MEVSILLFTFVPVMLGQASAIKARNQVFEYPPLSKLAGCFLYHGTGCKDTNISSFHQLFLLFSFVLYIRHHLYSTSTTSLYSTSSTSLIPFPATTLLPQPQNRHRRHRLTDVDDVDLEGVEQEEMKRCCYRNYVSPVTIISCPLKSILSYKILNRVNSPRIHYQIIRKLIRFQQHLLPNT